MQNVNPQELNMPLITFQPKKGEMRQGRMFSPKKITSLEAWLKAARAIIPQIPDTRATDWYVKNAEATPTHVKFYLLNSVGDWATVEIDRRVPGPFGR